MHNITLYNVNNVIRILCSRFYYDTVLKCDVTIKGLFGCKSCFVLSSGSVITLDNELISLKDFGVDWITYMLWTVLYVKHIFDYSMQIICYLRLPNAKYHRPEFSKTQNRTTLSV